MSDSEHNDAEEQQQQQQQQRPGRSMRSPRPVSTMALEFNSFLEGAFNLGGEIPTLMDNVQDRQDKVSRHNRELEELEARLKAMEALLSKANSGSHESHKPAPQETEVSTQADTSNSAPPPPPSRAPPPPVPTGSHRPPSRAPPSRPTTAGRSAAAGDKAYEYETQPMPEARAQSEYGIAH